MRIKSSNGNATTNVVKPKRAARVVVLSKAKIDGVYVPSSIAPMPKLKQGWIGKRVQGGHAPVPYRSRSADWGTANKKARV